MLRAGIPFELEIGSEAIGVGEKENPLIRLRIEDEPH